MNRQSKPLCRLILHTSSITCSDTWKYGIVPIASRRQHDLSKPLILLKHYGDTLILNGSICSVATVGVHCKRANGCRYRFHPVLGYKVSPTAWMLGALVTL